MTQAITLLAALAALAVLTALHLAFWSWRLGVPTREDEVAHASTGDGWTLSMGRRIPRAAPRRPPVLLVHGMAMNRQAFDFGVERYSVSAFLARSGFDCFALDLRGAGVLLGRNAPEVVFPMIRDFLLEQSEEAPSRAARDQPAGE